MHESAGRFSRHATHNSLIKQRLGSLELRGLYQTDVNRPDGITMISWEMGKQLVWEVTIVDALAPSRLNQGSLCKPGTTATEAEARKIEKFCKLIDNGYIFQPVTNIRKILLAHQGNFGSQWLNVVPCKNLGA